MNKLIAVAGNMGSGKTTLCKNIENIDGITLLYEDFDKNPFLNRFYDDMPTWALRSQLKFLIDRHVSISEISTDDIVVQDRSIYEDIFVFCLTMHEEGLISEEDWKLYELIATNILKNSPRPNLIINVKCSVPTLMTRIAKRGRVMERHLDPEYLSSLDVRYKRLMCRLKGEMIVIDVDSEARDLRNPKIAADVLSEALKIIS